MVARKGQRIGTRSGTTGNQANGNPTRRTTRRPENRGIISNEPPQRRVKTNMLQFMKKIITDAIKPLTERIAQLEGADPTPAANGTSGHTPNPTISGTALTTTGGMSVVLVQPPNKPRYGLDNKVHPVDFLKDFERYLDKTNQRPEALAVVMECLTGSAKSWAQILMNNWKTLEDFKRDFMEQYWGQATQIKNKKDIAYGTWDHKDEMVTHFTTKCALAKRLDTYTKEEEYVTDIMGHFPNDIKRLWVATNQKTAAEAMQFLQKMGDIGGATSTGNERSQAQTTTKPNKARFARQNHIRQVRADNQSVWRNRTKGSCGKPMPYNTENQSLDWGFYTHDNNSFNEEYYPASAVQDEGVQDGFTEEINYGGPEN